MIPRKNNSDLAGVVLFRGETANPLPSQFIRYQTILAALFQALLVFTALVLAWLLRFDFSLPYRGMLFSAVPLLILIRLAAIGRFHLFHGWWRYTGVSDALDIVKATALGSGIFLFVMRFLLGVVSFPRTIYILEAVLSSVLLGGVRLVSRVFMESMSAEVGPRRKVMLIGAGSAAEIIIREIHCCKNRCEVVGCVDDDESKLGIKLQGVPVLGTVDQLPSILAMQPVDEILIAVPSATSKQMKRFVQICEECGTRFKTLPALHDIITGDASIREFRDVHLEDLLGRDPVEIDLRAVRKMIEGRVVLVTGAAGSIGSELCRQVLEYNPSTLVCLDQSETGIFFLEQELSRTQTVTQAVYCVADICDSQRVRYIFAQYRPDAVFHAAAYKHVPVMERNVHEALKNNVFALLNLLQVADQNKCGSFILISSDKAVNPTSVMGATKRIGELIISRRPTNGMRCVSVRFGNVLGSNGSVVPVFQEQLRRNQPLSITHPEIKRFFMTAREAVSLVLQAFAIGDRGDTLVLDMGKPVRIVDLARTLIRISGKSEREVGVSYTGLRKGEKLNEEIFYSNEGVHPTSFEKIKRIRGPLAGWIQLQQGLEELKMCTDVVSAEGVREKIKAIVPEYCYEANEKTAAPGPIQVRVRVQDGLRLNSVPVDGD
jgi:FlaA1/EpsC-like NDP-sugar epimerase